MCFIRLKVNIMGYGTSGAATRLPPSWQIRIILMSLFRVDS